MWFFICVLLVFLFVLLGSIIPIFISVIVLLFVMYHAQTINGGRFAEMRLNDHLLASLILFHDFIIIFLLTFYAQIVYRVASSASTTKGPPLQETWIQTTPDVFYVTYEDVDTSTEDSEESPGEEPSPDEGSIVFF
ncbi:uncharacterized protein [Drosophila takahashii]